jgi:hypothetical protein
LKIRWLILAPNDKKKAFWENETGYWSEKVREFGSWSCLLKKSGGKSHEMPMRKASHTGE